jgi:hypothetical protein
MATAPALWTMWANCSRVTRCRSLVSVPTTSLYSSASATATPLASSQAAMTPAVGGWSSTATTSASPTMAP